MYLAYEMKLKEYNSSEKEVYYKYQKTKNWNPSYEEDEIDSVSQDDFDDFIFQGYFPYTTREWKRGRVYESKRNSFLGSSQRNSREMKLGRLTSRKYREVSNYDDLEESTKKISYDVLPFRVVIYLLEFFVLNDDHKQSYQGISTKNQVVSLLFGRFKHDKMRKPFLIFRNLKMLGKSYYQHREREQEFNKNRISMLKKLPENTKSLNLSYLIIDDCPQQLESLRLVLPRCQNSSGEVFLKDIYKIQKLINPLPKTLLNFEIHVYPPRFHLLFDLLNCLPRTLTSFTFRTLSHKKTLYFFDANISKSFQNLRSLNLGVMIFTQKGLTNLPKSLVNLELESEGNVTYEGLSKSFQHLKKLKNLVLKFFQIRREGLKGLNKKSLRKLVIHCNHRLLDSDIILDLFPTLSDNENHSQKYQIRELHLNYCHLLTTKTLDAIRKNRNPHTFERLELVHSKIESEDVDEFRRLCPQVRVKFSKKIDTIDYRTYRRT